MKYRLSKVTAKDGNIENPNTKQSKKETDLKGQEELSRCVGAQEKKYQERR